MTAKASLLTRVIEAAKTQIPHERRACGLALKSFLVITAAAAVFIFFSSCRPAPGTLTPRVDGELAFQLVKKAVSFGIRPSGSEECRKHAEWIAAQAREYGAEVSIQEFEDATPAGSIRFRNVVAKVRGKSNDFVVAGSHFDTKSFPSGIEFQGANDGASSTGLLLAMIKAACQAKDSPPLTLEFVFFDGEECMVSYGGNDGLHGSRRYVKLLKESGNLPKCRAMLLLDMVGDRDLFIALPSGTPKKMAELLFDIAEGNGTRKHFGWNDIDMLDDHKPFTEAGIPAIDLIDFNFGPGNSYWHTKEDTLDKLDAKSLQIAGDAALGFLWELPRILGNRH